MLDCLEIIDESQKYAIEGNEASRHDADPSGSIFAIIKSMCIINQKTMSAELSAIEKRVLSKGFSMADFERTLNEYQKLNVVMVSNGWVTMIN